ncbi:MAG TPA: DUF3108 domain-containing protein, partial [Ramlibacter sp.]|nr:DUF3108 domain-containing protein [Ramlibacter sp.]
LQDTAIWFAPAPEPSVRKLAGRVIPAPPPAAASAGVPVGTASLREPALPQRLPRGLAVSRANPSTPPPSPRASPIPPAAPTPSPAAPLAQSTPLLAPPPPATLHYELTVHRRGAILHGQARLDWRHDGEAYELRQALTVASLPPRVHASRGRIAPHGLVPDYFHARARGEQATHFDHAGGRVVFSSSSPQATLAAGMQDPLSVVMQLSMSLAADAARMPSGARIALPTAGTRDAGPWIFEVIGTEDLDLPGGRMHALKLERPPRSTYDQRIELWLAPREAYAPVRLRLTTPDGGVVDQRWASTDRP